MLSYFPPAERLKGLVGATYVLRTGPLTLADHLPALLPQVQVILSGGMSHTNVNGEVQPAPPVAVKGPANGAGRILVGPGTVIVGIGLLPLGWAKVVGACASECADMVIDAAAMWGDRCVRQLLDRMQGASEDYAKAALLAGLVEDVFSRQGRAADPRIGVIDRWLGTAPKISVDALAQRLELSHRQAARLTTSTHGAAPKLLAMKYRALQGAAALATSRRPEWLDAGEGYSDQSHLIRHFHRFVGVTPGEFTRARQALARQTILGRWNAGVRSPIALWS